MSSGGFACLSHSEDDDIPRSEIVNTMYQYLSISVSISMQDSGLMKVLKQLKIRLYSPSESLLGQKQKNARLAPLYLPGACGGSVDIDTPNSVIRRRISTPISFNTNITQ